MGSELKTAVISSMALTLAACTTTPNFKHMDPEARKMIQSVDSVLITKQDGVKADINVSRLSSYIQGHFVPVLIDIGLNSYRSHKANKIMVPIHQTLGDYDYTQDIKAQFNQALAKSNVAGAGELEILREEPQGFRAAYIRKSEADAVMFIDVKYAFTPTFDALNLTSAIMVFPVNPALSPYKEKPNDDDILAYEDNIYRNQFMASIVPATMVGTKDENGALWGQMSEEELAGRMQKAAKKLAEVIANDLATDELLDEPSGDIAAEINEPANEPAATVSATG